ncbi:MAG: ABC transporter substrate-binding protein [Thermomicrobiales bacterium]|nr:ABC transporter substrate-binding protein [Thermomicrobiales bacterium]
MHKVSQVSSRRTLLGATAATLAALATTRLPVAGRAATAQEALASSLVIDLTAEPATLDPALTYDIDGWSVVHSVYDAPVQLGPGGVLQMVAAESLEQVDPLTWELKLKPGLTFHNGEPLESSSVTFSVAHMQNPETASQVAGNFAVVESVEEVDELTARLHLSAPAPWLPSQLAPWIALLPPAYAADPANDFALNPVGTGPYVFKGWERGSSIALERNPEYFGGDAKGAPIAEAVTFRFVQDGTTRVADLLSGTSQIIGGVPLDQAPEVEASATMQAAPVAGCAFVRVPNDVEPFTDPRVRQALNHAVDVEGIIASLLGGYGQRLANFFVPNGMGFNADLAPYAYDPELAKSLLADAGYPDGFQTSMAISTLDRIDLGQAIAGQLAAVGIQTELQTVEIATFNGQWKDPEAAPLRLVSWRPVIDPYTLLSLLVSSSGFLSRYDDPEAQTLIDAAAVEPDTAKRVAIYEQLGDVLFESPAGIYLWNRTAFYGSATDTPAWTQRPDEWLLPLLADATEG